jgi:hypothetical protein
MGAVNKVSNIFATLLDGQQMIGIVHEIWLREVCPRN